ncbi:MAG: RNA polymerase sigma factor [Planctomycetota bacterium]
MESGSLPPSCSIDDLVRRHEQALRRFVSFHAATVVRRRESVSDLVQTVFRELLVAGRRAKFERETQFRHWLFVTARNKLRDRLKFHLRGRRSPRREQVLPVNPELSDVWRDAVVTFCTPMAAIISTEECERIERCFQRLSEEHREVILLRQLGEMSAAEIGAVIGRGEGATRALLSRALARFSALLQEE